MTKPSASLPETSLFAAVATKGWAWCTHNAELAEQTAALSNLKLLVGSGCLELTKGIAGRNSLISLRQCVTFSEHAQLKGWRSRFQPTEAKSWISTILHWLAAQKKTKITINILQSKSWMPQVYFLQAWCNHHAKLVERTAALRDYKLLVGSGCLEVSKGLTEIDSLDKHVEQSSLRQGVTFSEHGQLKGRRPHFQPTVAKSSISTNILWFAAVTYQKWEHNHCIVCNKSWRRQLRDQTLCFSTWDVSCSAAATKGWAWCIHNAELVERTAALGYLKLLVGSGCLEFQTGMARMSSSDKHVKQISFRQCVTFCEQRQQKGWQPRFQPTVAKSLVGGHIGAQ